MGKRSVLIEKNGDSFDFAGKGICYRLHFVCIFSLYNSTENVGRKILDKREMLFEHLKLLVRNKINDILMWNIKYFYLKPFRYS